ncbi:MAG: glycosyltransferase [Pseudomonadota bacterium]
MTAAADVSVIVVSHGRPASLALTLKALEYQRYRNFEVIVVSDISPAARPDSPLAVRWFDFADRNISAARNIGLAAARGDIVAFCDDDAVPEFAWLSHLIPPFDDPKLGAAGGYTRGRNGVSFQWRCVLFDSTGADHPGPDPGDAPRVIAPQAGRYLKTVGTNCAFRAAALRQIGGFDAAFRFFLDEADVNLRLAEAGWATAIVPLAEVHHGYAAGPFRRADRVPRSLHELGASLAHFLNKHAPPAARAARLDAFRAEQRQRLDAHFLSGRLQAAAMHDLLHSLEAGFKEGDARTPVPADFTAGARGGFAPAPLPPPGPARLFITPLGRTTPPPAARGAAAAGAEVTVVCPQPGTRPLSVQFVEDGFFLHRFGLLGRAERDHRRPLSRVRARIAAECARIAPQRGVLEPDQA